MLKCGAVSKERARRSTLRHLCMHLGGGLKAFIDAIEQRAEQHIA